MGQLGMQELILIFFVALLVFGPRKLPELGKSLGKGLREFRRATNDLKATWDEQLRDAGSDVKETARDLRNIERTIQKDLRDEPPSRKTPESPAPPASVGHGTTTPPPVEEAGKASETPS